MKRVYLQYELLCCNGHKWRIFGEASPDGTIVITRTIDHDLSLEEMQVVLRDAERCPVCCMPKVAYHKTAEFEWEDL